MAQSTYVFTQSCSLLLRDFFEYLVKKYFGNAHVKSYTCWNHLLVMLWAQLTGRESLRDIESSLRAHGDKLYRLGMGRRISRNVISHANATRPVMIFRDLASRMMGRALSITGSNNSELSHIFSLLEITGLFAVDSSTITFDLSQFQWAVPQDGLGGVKLHTLYDILR